MPSTSKTSTKKSNSKKSVTKKAAVTKAPVKGKVPGIGKAAPAFMLFNQDGKPVSLKEYAGKHRVVLYFYPRAMTPGCTVQACGIRDTAALFKKVGAVVLGVSPDKVASLTKFHKRDKLNFDLLSDVDCVVSKKYGVWGLKKFMGREFMGVRRWTFIIGKDGKIKHIIDDVNTKTHHDDVMAILASMK